MSSTRVETIGGYRAFADRFSGELVLPTDSDYDSRRRIWNGSIDRRPAVIARCRSVADVSGAVRFAREHGLVVAVRSGGHSYPGHSVCDDGMVIDLSQLTGVEFGADDTTVRLGAGHLLGAVDRATTARGKVVPAGIVSHTGFAGLTLGGGFGSLTRSHGMTCDHVVGCQVVTADGEVRYASEDENPDLHWALRGGGGNFGIVTRFEMALRDLPTIVAARTVYPMDNVVGVIEGIRDLVEAGPRTLNVRIGIGSAALEGLAPEVRGGVFGVRVIYQGDESDEVFREVVAHGDPVYTSVGPIDYLTLQSELDEEFLHGVGWYMKSAQTRTLSRELIEAAAQSAVEYRQVASERVQRSIHSLTMLGGAASDVPEMATAYPGRAAQWHFALEVGFTDAVEQSRIIGATRESWAKVEPALDMSTSYVNMFFDEEISTLSRVYGPEKFARLRSIKTTYDPDNLFRHNSNIPPAVSVLPGGTR